MSLSLFFSSAGFTAAQVLGAAKYTLVVLTGPRNPENPSTPWIVGKWSFLCRLKSDLNGARFVLG
jgi:hypothetical protein